MEPTYTLSELGVFLRRLDKHMVSILGMRSSVAREVIMTKQWLRAVAEKNILAQAGEKNKDLHQSLKKNANKLSEMTQIIRSKVEVQRIKMATDMANEAGVDKSFAAGLMRWVIDRSCHEQLLKLQANLPFEGKVETEDQQYKRLKKNLSKLVRIIIKEYDDRYYGTKTPYAVEAYLSYERKVLDRVIASLPDHEMAIDVGCATGKVSAYLSDKFDKVIGYDLVRDMIKKADVFLEQNPKIQNVKFEKWDIERGFPKKTNRGSDLTPIPDNSVSLIVLNIGTASEFRNTDKFIKEASRVLKPGGKLLMSFYNEEALLYRHVFFTWRSSLNAEYSAKKQSLIVRLGKKTYHVYAKPTTVDKIKQLFNNGLRVDETSTFPTTIALMPNECFMLDFEYVKSIKASRDKAKIAELTKEQAKLKEVRKLHYELDKAVSDMNLGTYIVAVITKKP